MLDSELDFRAEAQAMEKIAAGVAHTVDGHRARPPIVVPRPVPGLCSGRVLVMEYVQVGILAAAAALFLRGGMEFRLRAGGALTVLVVVQRFLHDEERELQRVLIVLLRLVRGAGTNRLFVVAVSS